MEKLMNKKEVAETFGVTVKAIDKWVCEKKIPYIKLSRKCVRFAPSEVQSFLNKLRVKVGVPPPPATRPGTPKTSRVARPKTPKAPPSTRPAAQAPPRPRTPAAPPSTRRAARR